VYLKFNTRNYSIAGNNYL